MAYGPHHTANPPVSPPLFGGTAHPAPAAGPIADATGADQKGGIIGKVTTDNGKNGYELNPDGKVTAIGKPSDPLGYGFFSQSSPNAQPDTLPGAEAMRKVLTASLSGGQKDDLTVSSGLVNGHQAGTITKVDGSGKISGYALRPADPSKGTPDRVEAIGSPAASDFGFRGEKVDPKTSLPTVSAMQDRLYAPATQAPAPAVQRPLAPGQ